MSTWHSSLFIFKTSSVSTWINNGQIFSTQYRYNLPIHLLNSERSVVKDVGCEDEGKANKNIHFKNIIQRWKVDEGVSWISMYYIHRVPVCRSHIWWVVWDVGCLLIFQWSITLYVVENLLSLYPICCSLLFTNTYAVDFLEESVRFNAVKKRERLE